MNPQLFQHFVGNKTVSTQKNSPKSDQCMTNSTLIQMKSNQVRYRMKDTNPKELRQIEESKGAEPMELSQNAKWIPLRDRLGQVSAGLQGN
jgi:hypothetical protein